MSQEENGKKSVTARIFDKLDKIEEHLSEINIILAKQHMSLDEHMRRTEMLEHELRPVSKHVEQMRGAGKLIALLALIATIVSIFTYTH